MRFHAPGFAALLIASAAMADDARDGIADPRFGSGGVATFTTIGTSTVSAPRDVVELADGKLLVVGRGRRSTSFRDQPAVFRLTAEGAIDSTFGEAGLFLYPEAGLTAPNGGSASSAVELSDGRIVVVGSKVSFDPFQNSGCTVVFALTANGALDSTYGPGPGPACMSFGFPFALFYDAIGNIARGPGNTVFVSGLLGSGAPGSAVIARLDAQGQFDAGFNDDGLAYFGSTFYSGMAVRSLTSVGGEIFVQGGQGGTGPAVARLAANGQLVGSFGNGGIASVDVFPGQDENAVGFDVDSDGRTALMSFTYESTGSFQVAVVRFDAAGDLDSGFNADGQHPGSVGIAYLQPAAPGNTTPTAGVAWRGTTMIAGLRPGFAVAALSEDGTYVSKFGDVATPGIASFPLGTAWFITVLRNGGIIIAGTPSTKLLKLVDDEMLVDGFE